MNNEFEFIKHTRFKYLKSFVVNMIYRNSHMHSDFEICLILEGSISVRTKRQEAVFSEGSIILFNPNEPHELRAINQNSVILSLQVSPKFCTGYFPSLGSMEFDKLCLNDVLDEHKTRTFTDTILGISYEYFSRNPSYEFKCMSLVNTLFYFIIKLIPCHITSEAERTRKADSLNRLKRITDYIDDNYQGKLLLSDIAHKENLSVTYLSHFFKNNLNMSFQEYLNNVRLERARQLIAQTDMKLIDICLESGFSDSRYLNRLFIKQYSCSPKEYREKLIPSEEGTSPSSSISSQNFYDKNQSLSIIERYLSQLHE